MGNTCKHFGNGCNISDTNDETALTENSYSHHEQKEDTLQSELSADDETDFNFASKRDENELVMSTSADESGFNRYSLTCSSGYSTFSSGNTSYKERVNISSFYLSPMEEINMPPVKRGLAKENESHIKRNFRYLKDELDVDCGLIDYFIQEDIFTEDQVDAISSAGSRRRKVDCFLRMLLRSKDSAYDHFFHVLSEFGYDHVRTFLESNCSNQTIDLENGTALCNNAPWIIIETHKVVILEQLEPDSIVDYFLQYEEFTVDEYESVISFPTRRAKAEKLLEILLYANHMPRGYYVFIRALEDTTENYLLEQLTKNTSGIQAESEPDDTVERPRNDKIYKIYSQRKQNLSEGKYWCFVLWKTLF
ncbi:uncharacterized protein LOC132737403 isoform X2 [Ruditapes philippinarum]|uniref:uncharacterized protein LOC132737403 isoform X2 n=1 Tax=Ruditapes philippinarum TaxID=129788 RepID=UPI00295BF607|nr:uncharacterized protein LOC132737403 isoform X2 [Ruditapes philippinarum]